MTHSRTSGKNVLAELDRRVPAKFYWSLTLLATLKNHSVEEITRLFEQEASGPPAPRSPRAATA